MYKILNWDYPGFNGNWPCVFFSHQRFKVILWDDLQHNSGRLAELQTFFKFSFRILSVAEIRADHFHMDLLMDFKEINDFFFKYIIIVIISPILTVWFATTSASIHASCGYTNITKLHMFSYITVTLFFGHTAVMKINCLLNEVTLSLCVCCNQSSSVLCLGSRSVHVGVSESLPVKLREWPPNIRKVRFPESSLRHSADGLTQLIESIILASKLVIALHGFSHMADQRKSSLPSWIHY